MTLGRLSLAMLMTWVGLALQPAAAAEKLRLMVAPDHVACATGPCLRLKLPLELDWLVRERPIRGYTHVEGVATLLLVDADPVEAPASADLALVETIGREDVPDDLAARLHALGGSAWRLQKAAPDDGLGATWRSHGASLAIGTDGRSLVGSTGCNRWRGSWTVAGQRIRMSPIATTLRACPEPLAQLERAFLRHVGNLVEVRWWGSELELVSGDGHRLLLDRLLE